MNICRWGWMSWVSLKTSKMARHHRVTRLSWEIKPRCWWETLCSWLHMSFMMLYPSISFTWTIKDSGVNGSSKSMSTQTNWNLISLTVPQKTWTLSYNPKSTSTQKLKQISNQVTQSRYALRPFLWLRTFVTFLNSAEVWVLSLIMEKHIVSAIHSEAWNNTSL